MNNNRGNNRRRGRGNNNRQQGGGGQQLNRIDSRARGNAPQMLEKYRKLAHDAHLNGDRVTEEYYLQFADHYFRVIADQRVRQEEQRARRDDRWQEGCEGYQGEADDGIDYGLDAEENGYEAHGGPQFHQPRRDDRYERGENRGEGRNGGERNGVERNAEGRGDNRGERREREDRPRREDRPQREDRDERPRRDDRGNRERAERQPVEEVQVEAGNDADQGGDQGADRGGDQGSLYEPAENPFTRENRVSRGLRPRRAPRAAPDDADEAPVGFDASVLPPSFTPAPVAEVEVEVGAVAEEKPKRPRGRPRKTPPPADDAGETLAATGTD